MKKALLILTLLLILGGCANAGKKEANVNERYANIIELIREHENLQKQNDGKNPGQEKQFEKTVKEKKTEKMMGYVPMRQYSLFDDKDQSKKS